MTAYIPYLGAILSGAVAVLVAFADRGWVIGLWALGLVLLVQMIEGTCSSRSSRAAPCRCTRPW